MQLAAPPWERCGYMGFRCGKGLIKAPQSMCSIEPSSSMFTQECRRSSYTERPEHASGALLAGEAMAIWRCAQVRPYMSGEAGRRSMLRYVSSLLNLRSPGSRSMACNYPFSLAPVE
jgi:hypothetical protein